MNSKKAGLIIFIFLAIIGCLSGNDRTDELVFREGVFSEKKVDDEFYRGITKKLLEQLNEKQINREEETIFRLSVFPSNLNKYVIILRLNDVDSSIQLTYKRLAGSLESEMDIHLEKKISKPEYTQVYSQLNSLLNKVDFWGLTNKWECDGADGDIYVMEGVRGGRYHLVCRWSPEVCKFRKWNEFSMLVNYIIRLKSI